ncbi:MAG: GIY-YIG nuclease family protein [Patescibacteria group bacterium]
MAYYVYILKSLKDGNFYTGYTSNLKNRINAHNSGKVKSTKHRKPFILIKSEEFGSRKEAMWREWQLKSKEIGSREKTELRKNN